jgi:hypothetical protein
MQEMLIPFMQYKDAYEKTEAAYEDLASQDVFKYLGNLPEGSRGKAIYDNYMKELNKQSEDLAKHGLNMGNRRALLNLKRRYQGEIGRLDAANTALQEERKLRRQLNAKDSSMIYANDNLIIDDFLDGQTPNLYNISGEDLRREGAQYAQAASSRIYGNTQVSNLTKYFQEIMQTQGYSPEVMAAFRKNLEAIPEFNQAVNDIMEARGVNDNLSGVNYQRARQSIINGIMEGALYKEARNVQQNPGVMTAALSASNALGWANHNESVRQHDLQLKMRGYDKEGNYNPDNDQELKKAKEVAKVQGKVDENGNPVKKGNTKTPNRKLKEARRYDGKGNVSPVTKTSNTKYGKKIDYAQALEIDPSVAQHDPGYEDQYEYFESDGKVTVVPMAAQVPDNNTQESEEDENQI